MRRLLDLAAERGALFNPHALVFASRKGSGLMRKVAREALKRAVKAAELAEPEPTLHDLRHSHASTLIAMDFSVVDVQRRLAPANPTPPCASTPTKGNTVKRNEAKPGAKSAACSQEPIQRHSRCRAGAARVVKISCAGAREQGRRNSAIAHFGSPHWDAPTQRVQQLGESSNSRRSTHNDPSSCGSSRKIRVSTTCASSAVA